MSVKRTAIDQARGTYRELSLVSVGASIFVLTALLAAVKFIIETHPERTLDVIVAYGVFIATFAIMIFARLQARLILLQLEQADELASRKDEASIAAIGSLTAELKRHFALHPSVVNWALFNLPVKGD